jgi:ATP-dependent Lon protease
MLSDVEGEWSVQASRSVPSAVRVSYIIRDWTLQAAVVCRQYSDAATYNMGCSCNKLKLRRNDVKYLETEKSYARLERMNATLSKQVTQLRNTLKQQYLENVQREATLCDQIRKLEKELAERKLRCKCDKLRIRLNKELFHKEMKKRYIDGLKKRNQKEECKRRYVEGHYQFMIKELRGELHKSK